VRIVKALSLCVALALSSAALVGTASASASGTAFTSEASEVAYRGVDNGLTLSVTGKTATCESELAPVAFLKGPQENLALINEAACTSLGITRYMKMNGCKLEFQPGTETSAWNGTFEGTYSIGPAGCGPVTVELFPGGCQLSIPAQTGLPVVYHNVGSGSKATIEAESKATNIKYSGCGSGENGSLLGSWILSGRDVVNGGLAAGVKVETLPHSPLFEADQYPITYAGSQSNTLLKFGSGINAECTSAAFTGTASGATKALTLSSSYSGCKAFGFYGTISGNGCHFVDEVSEKTSEGHYAGPGSLTCPSGASLEVVAGNCTVSVPAQSMGTLAYEDTVESGVYKVKSTTAAKGLTYTVTRDGFFCPFEGTGTRTNGEVSGQTTFTGKNEAGETGKIRIGG
jgi:hypothetical protein